MSLYLEREEGDSKSKGKKTLTDTHSLNKISIQTYKIGPGSVVKW